MLTLQKKIGEISVNSRGLARIKVRASKSPTFHILTVKPHKKKTPLGAFQFLVKFCLPLNRHFGNGVFPAYH